MWLLVAFIAVPLIEIALFIQVGGAIGLWPTLLVVVLTAIAGTVLVRGQGLQAIADLRGAFDRLEDPAEPLAHGAMILVSGVLLLTPGFFTDALGFALLTPPMRRILIGRLRGRIQVGRMQRAGQPGQPPRSGPARPRPDPSATARPPGAATRPRPDVVDADYVELDPDDVAPKPGDRPSGWTRGEGSGQDRR